MINKILIADDSQTIRSVAEFLLRQKGYEVILAKDGEETLDLANKYTPDLIFLDNSLPLMRGDILYHKLKENPMLKEVPVVMLLNSGESLDQGVFSDMENISYILKPFSPRELLEKVEKYSEKEKVIEEKNSEQENIMASIDDSDEFKDSPQLESRDKESYQEFVTEFKKEIEGLQEDEPQVYRKMKLEPSGKEKEINTVDLDYENLTRRIISEISAKVAEKISEKIDTLEIKQMIKEKVKELV
ncbi:MAG: response regulator [candidate division Zixibacteria bacterium]|nr:response regulator [candidate division Zixibacteria bacterium]